MELLPGDEVSYYLVVHDNDAISGPKAATSETHLLRFPSPMERYEKVEMEEVSYIEQLNDLLEQQQKIRKETEKLRDVIDEEKLQPDSSRKPQEKDSAQWQQQQKMEQLKGDQEDLGKQLEDLQKDIQQTMERLNDPDTFSMKTLQKMAKIEDLMNQLLTDEMKQVLNQFQRTLNEMSKNQPVQSMENLDLSIQDFEENLDRMLALLENSMLERQIETMIQQVEALKQQQDMLEQDTEQLESESEELAEDDSPLSG